MHTHGIDGCYVIGVIVEEVTVPELTPPQRLRSQMHSDCGLTPLKATDVELYYFYHLE